MQENKTSNTGKDMMAQSKFYMGYSRWIDSAERYETWEESVERVMQMHRNKYKDVMTPELESYIAFAEGAYKGKLGLGAQRALQFGGEQLIAHPTRAYNCFHKDTKFVTSEGVRSFGQFNHGDNVKVITHTGTWKGAVVKCYGKQKLNKVVIKKQSHFEEVLVTENHRWILKDGSETTNLSVGNLLYKPKNTFAEFNYEDADPLEKLYWCYGLVYGDGTLCKNKKGDYTSSMIRLCGAKNAFKERFEDMGFKTSTSSSLDSDFMAYTGSYLKTLPNPKVDSPEMIRAFVAGYLAADGEKNRSEGGTNYLSIQSSNAEGIKFIRECFPIAGVWIVSEKELMGDVTNYGVRPYTVFFRISDNMGSIHNAGWKVSSIEEGFEDDVWCLEVEDDKSFVMPCGIVTGNCASTYCDRPAYFQETFYTLLCGAGVGFSVQKQHIAKLPSIAKRSEKKVKVFQVPDSIEGWADSIGVLMSSYFTEQATFPEYKGCQVHFDFSKVRPKGAMISGGFKAPGPDGLRNALIKCESLLERVTKKGEVKLKPINAYDITMYIADAVLSGGVRRSATLCMFSKDDKEMLNAKTGDWYYANPQRGRSNNSVMIKRDELTREEWAEIMKSVKQVGEPGFIFTDSLEFAFNPCVEIGMLPVTEAGESGFQLCNLTEINGGKCNTFNDFLNACAAQAVLGTLQAGYTDFKYVSKATKEITEREALIGVSTTGWMNNPDVLFNERNMQEGAKLVKSVNAKIAKLIGINPAARTTCVKPSGNASVLLGTASGIHGEHSPMYFRNVQMNETDEVAGIIEKVNPKMIEKSVWSSNGTDFVVSFPVISKEGSIYKNDLLGVKQLEFVKLAQQNWIEYGTNKELCTDSRLRHNVSNTITVDDWDEVEQYLFDNRDYFAGVSLLSSYGDKAYAQAPFTEVITAEAIMKSYGEGSMFASGLIVEGLHAFNNNLWLACDTLQGFGLKLSEDNSDDLLKRDWIRRAKKFTDNYFEGDITKMTFCLKDCFNLHKWTSIQKTMKPIDFSVDLSKKKYTEVDTIGSAACAGGVCSLEF